MILLKKKQKVNIIVLIYQDLGGMLMNQGVQVIRGFRDLYNKMVFLNKIKMEERLKDYKSSEVHCIEYIGGNTDANVTKLAEYFFMTRGALSKITKKLINKEIIESYQKADNKKEIYFRLTFKGKEIYKIHESLHKEFQERDSVVFDQVSEEQYNIMLDFIENYGKHLDEEIKKQGIVITQESDIE